MVAEHQLAGIGVIIRIFFHDLPIAQRAQNGFFGDRPLKYALKCVAAEANVITKHGRVTPRFG